MADKRGVMDYLGGLNTLRVRGQITPGRRWSYQNERWKSTGQAFRRLCRP